VYLHLRFYRKQLLEQLTVLDILHAQQFRESVSDCAGAEKNDSDSATTEYSFSLHHPTRTLDRRV